MSRHYLSRLYAEVLSAQCYSLATACRLESHSGKATAADRLGRPPSPPSNGSRVAPRRHATGTARSRVEVSSLHHRFGPALPGINAHGAE